MNTCKICSNQFESKFCPECGTKAKQKRIDWHYILHELEHSLLHVDGGIFYTIKELTIRPGRSVVNFIEGEKERIKHFKPFGFLILTSLIYGFVSHYLGYEEPITPDEAGQTITEWIEKHNNYGNLIAIVFIALGLRYIFYFRRGYNFFEYLVLMAFLTGQIMVMGLIAEPLSGLFKSELPANIYLIVAFLYCTWAIGGFFRSKNFWGYLKAFTAYTCSIFIFMILVIIADEIIKTL